MTSANVVGEEESAEILCECGGVVEFEPVGEFVWFIGPVSELRLRVWKESSDQQRNQRKPGQVPKLKFVYAMLH